MTFRTGVVVGKFLPPHAGHHALIDFAQRQTIHLHVIVCEKPGDPILGAARAAWLQEEHPLANVFVIDDRYDATDSRIWAANTIRWLGAAPDAVFTSETYGDAYASHMGSRHVPFDASRIRMPCSGTAIRDNPSANWRFLRGGARSWYAKRVCVLGAESTGTTTLAQALASSLSTSWVPEFGRTYSAEKLARGETRWTSDEFRHIAREQTSREDQAARQANRVLICDTNAFATTLWHRRYMGFDNEELQAIAKQVRCDLYILTGDEIPFVQDGLRDGEAIRHEMHGWFEQALARQSTPWILVRGEHSQRLQQALAVIRLCVGSPR